MSVDLSLKFSLLLVPLLLAFTVPSPHIMEWIVLVGQAHILLGYYYKFVLPKKVKKNGYRIFLLFLMILPCFYLVYTYPTHFIFAIISLFLLHHFFDEMTLCKAEKSIDNYWAMVPVIMALVFHLYDLIYVTNFFGNADIWLLMACCGTFLYSLLWNRTGFALYVSAIGAGVSACLFFFDVTTWHVLFFIIMSHFFNWYVHVGQKLHARSKAQFTQYLRHVAIMNGLLVCVFFLSRNVEMLAFINYALFTGQAFYAGTALHFVASFRKEDIPIKFWNGLGLVRS